MGLFLAESGSNPSKGVTWCYYCADYDHAYWHNQLPTAKDILYEVHWYVSELLLRDGIHFPDWLVYTYKNVKKLQTVIGINIKVGGAKPLMYTFEN